MQFCFLSVILVTGLLCFTTADYPNDPQRCKYGDEECIKKIILYYLVQKNQGESALNLVKIEPLNVAKIEVKQGTDSPVNIDLTFYNATLNGFKNTLAVTKVKGFDKDLTQKHEIHLKMKSVTLLGQYSIKGKILILPISGSGATNMTMEDLDMRLYFKGTPYEKNGEKYMKLVNMKLTADPGRLYYRFDNLFNGDKALGDNMNLFLNENWKEIYDEVRGSITYAFARIFESVINQVFSKYPYDKFFVE